MNGDWDDDDDVGYKRPPRWTQFQKGASGNPKGRPKKQRAPVDTIITESQTDDDLRAALAQPIKVTEAGKVTERTMRQVVLRAQLNTAAKGNPYAQREVVRQMRELDEREAAYKAAKIEQEKQTFDYVVRHQQQQAQKWAGIALGDPEPEDPWPHPDDFVIDHGKRKWTVIGPYDEADLPLFEHYRAQRDLMIARSILYRRKRDKSANAMAPLFDLWVQFDVMLPKRWQIRDEELDALLAFFWLLPMPDLRAFEKTYCRRADDMERRAKLPPRDKEVYQAVNTVLKPLLKRHGYRSLAQFEHAYAQSGNALAWPIRKSSKGGG